EAKQGRFEAAARVAARAFQLAGAAPPAPEESIRIHALLRAGDHPLAVTLASEVAGYGLPVPSSAAEARALLDADRSDDVPHRLPHRGGCFVGRQVELAELSRVLALPDRRLLTLVGPGGMGKTRLALEAAHQALGAGAFQHGVFFVDLAAVRNSHAVAGAIAEVLGLDLPAGADPLARLAEHLRGKQVLLVL